MSKITIDRDVLEMAIKKLHMLLLPVPAKETTAIMLAERVSVLATEVCGLLQKALAQPQQEPVDALDNPRPVGEITWGGCVSWNGSIPEYGTDLYTSPPARRPLTDWVSVDERLPEKGGYYLVTVDTDDGPHVDVLLFNGKHWEHEGEPTFCLRYLFSPTHWANRPEAAHGIKESK